jgi:MYXO-CTERM domain-containing protein
MIYRLVTIALLLATPAFAQITSIDPVTNPVLDLDTPSLTEAASLRSALPDPLIYGIPDRYLPGRAWLKVANFSHDRLGLVGVDEKTSGEYLAKLDEIGRETGVHIAFLRRSQFGWAIVDVSALETPLVRPGEELTVRLVDALETHKDVRGTSTSTWFRKFFTPNDPGLGQMWHLDAIQARTAWDQTRGLATQRVGVVDTGTRRTHQDLASKDETGFDFISISNVAVDGDGRDAEYNDPGDGGDCGFGPEEDSWHGSHVAGTIVAAADNQVGIAGVNHNARLVTGRALGRCGGSDGDILEAMAWMAGFNVDGVPDIGADRVSVINLSLGADTGCGQVQQDFVSAIVNAGTQVVAAAGNSGNQVPVAAPASCTGAIAVGAHGPGVGRPLANYSNFGPRLDIIAPGGEQQNDVDEGVLSACGPQNDCYTFQQGTSMAAPHIAGVVSLMQAANPGISRDDIVDILQSTGEPCTNCGTKVAVRLDLALAAAAGLPPPPPPEGEFGVAPCDFDGSCPTGQTCLGTPSGTQECFLDCAGSNSCESGTQCLQVDVGVLNVCVNAGTGGEGADCEGLDDCGPGHFCVGATGASKCTARCDLDYTCPHPEQACEVAQDGSFALCTPDSSELDPPPTAAPPPQPLPTGGDCDIRRGHWDCPSGFGCSATNDGDTVGTCIANAHGEARTGGTCDSDQDCEGGLCDRGVCTTPCDFGCRDGFACEADIIPEGGMCRPESCSDSRGGICEPGWVCTYTSTSQYACTVNGDDAFGGPFSCAEVSGEASAPFWLFALLLLGVRRRRR